MKQFDHEKRQKLQEEEQAKNKGEGDDGDAKPDNAAKVKTT